MCCNCNRLNVIIPVGREKGKLEDSVWAALLAEFVAVVVMATDEAQIGQLLPESAANGAGAGSVVT